MANEDDNIIEKQTATQNENLANGGGQQKNTSAPSDKAETEKTLEEMLVDTAEVPIFVSDEIQLGAVIGNGAFASVYGVRYIRLSDYNSKKTNLLAGDDRKEARHLLAKQFNNDLLGRNGYSEVRTQPIDYANDPSKKPPPRLVLKKLKIQQGQQQQNTASGGDNQSNNPQNHIQQGQKDMRTEIEILLRLMRPPKGPPRPPNHDQQTRLPDAQQETTSAAADNNNNNNSSAMNHPHIITLHGIVYDSYYDVYASLESTNSIPDSPPPCPSLILSKLHTTLSTQINSWKNERGMLFGTMKEMNAFTNSYYNKCNTNHHQRWMKRIIVLSQITSAIQFMHEHNIIYRDIKPDNIGLDIDNIPKLFDFGLAKSLHGLPATRLLPPSSQQSSSLVQDYRYDVYYQQSYKLTGETGSPRYMSPEVSTYPHALYGIPADVYSLAILFHEVLTLKLPYANFNYHQNGGVIAFLKAVRVGNLRPDLEDMKCWPMKLQKMVLNMWSKKITSRPTAKEIKTQLEQMLRGSNEQLFPYLNDVSMNNNNNNNNNRSGSTTTDSALDTTNMNTTAAATIHKVNDAANAAANAAANITNNMFTTFRKQSSR